MSQYCHWGLTIEICVLGYWSSETFLLSTQLIYTSTSRPTIVPPSAIRAIKPHIIENESEIAQAASSAATVLRRLDKLCRTCAASCSLMSYPPEP